MKLKLFLIAVVLVLSCVFMFACTDDTTDPSDSSQQGGALETNKYAVKGAELSTAESRLKLEEKYEELQILFNLAVDTVAKTGGDAKESVKAVGNEMIKFMENKVSNPEYAKYEAFVKDAITQIDDYKRQLTNLVPSIAS